MPSMPSCTEQVGAGVYAITARICFKCRTSDSFFFSAGLLATSFIAETLALDRNRLVQQQPHEHTHRPNIAAEPENENISPNQAQDSCEAEQ